MHNIPTVVDGIRFDSKAEAKRYGELKLLERAGAIKDLRVHPTYKLAARITYEGDFEYQVAVPDGFASLHTICEDVKGVETQVFKVKAKLFREKYPDIELRIVKAK